MKNHPIRLASMSIKTINFKDMSRESSGSGSDTFNLVTWWTGRQPATKKGQGLLYKRLPKCWLKSDTVVRVRKAKRSLLHWPWPCLLQHLWNYKNPRTPSNHLPNDEDLEHSALAMCWLRTKLLVASAVDSNQHFSSLLSAFLRALFLHLNFVAVFVTNVLF